MTSAAATILLAITATALILVAATFVLAIARLLQGMAYDRARERRYADEWQRTHRANQRRRYDITDVAGRPE